MEILILSKKLINSCGSKYEVNTFLYSLAFHFVTVTGRSS